MNTGKPVAFLLLAGLLLFSLACTNLVTPGSADVTGGARPTKDVDATVRAAVSRTLQAIVSPGQPQATPELSPTMAVGLQATIAALLATLPAPVFPTPLSPVVSPSITPVALATDATPTPAPTLSPRFPPAPVATPRLGPTATPVPTATPAPQPSATPIPPTGCSPAPEGTVVTALIFGQQVASGAVENGSYVLLVEQPQGGAFAGKTVTFKVNGINAPQSGIWRQGGADIIDLAVTPIPSPQPTAQPFGSAPNPTSGIGPLAQPLRPHVFVGTASICSP